eukprot:208470_1
MQSLEFSGTDNTKLLSSSKSTDKKEKWSTFQVILFVLFGMILAGIFSNLDRIISSLKDNKNETTQNNYALGHNMRQYFAFDNDFIEFNSGGGGNVPLQIINYEHDMRMNMESCPECWNLKRDSFAEETLRNLAKYLGIEDYKDLSFIINVSHGVNAVFRSMAQIIFNNNCSGSTCKILQFNTAHNVVKHTLDFINNDLASFGRNQLITFQVTKEMFVNTSLLLHELEIFMINNNVSSIYAAIICHIAPYPTILYDIKQIISLFHQYDIISVIDGAHGFGQLDINISDLNPDIYVADAHKWLFSPKGTGVIYVKKEFQSIIFPSIISSRGYNTTHNWQNIFAYQGNMDYTLWYSMNESLNWRECVGEQNILHYNHKLCIDGAMILTDLWGTMLMTNDNNYYHSMINPILPTQNQTEIYMIQDILLNHYSPYTYIKTREWNGVYYIRISCQIWLELSDFKWLGEAILNILSQIRNDANSFKHVSAILHQDVC